MQLSNSTQIFLDRLRDPHVRDDVPTIIDRPYHWLSDQLNESGALYDHAVKSTLDHQYHSAWFILSSAILHTMTRDNTYKENFRKSARYLLKIDPQDNRNSNPFIGLPLTLSCLYETDQNTTSKIKRYIEYLEYIPEYDAPNANNIHCLKMISLVMKEKVLDLPLKPDDRKFIENIVQNKLPEWQLNDGYFYDKPYNVASTPGIPHLTYHATITMLTILSAIMMEDAALFQRGERGLHALEHMVSPAGESGAYGRSNNAIFGTSSVVFAISLYNSVIGDDRFSNLYTLLTEALRHQIASDGHFCIVPNDLEQKRAGYDKYMFRTVYGSWAVGMLLLSHLLNPVEEIHG